MRLTCTPELREYMNKSGKHTIIVEVIVSDSSDFEVSELHVHFVNEKQAKLFIEKDNFHPFKEEWGTVLLPNYKLEYQEEVVFDLKKVLFVHTVKQTGIRL